MTRVFSAYAPASSANLSVGFDLLGIAVRPVSGQPLGDFVTARELGADEQGNAGPDLLLKTEGRYSARLPADPKRNIVCDAYELYGQFLREKGMDIKRLELTLQKNLPVCSGLGSSASSVVAAVMALDAVHGVIFGEEGCLEMMGQLEGKISGSIHYDNVAPCFYGGMQLIINEGEIISQSIPHFDNWYWVLCFPGIKVSTSEARAILPAQYLRQDVITFGRRLSTFVHASYSKNESLAASCLVDVVAEPYRASLIPGFVEAREHGRAIGALSTGISGSGSTIFSIFTDESAAVQMKEYLERQFIANEDGFCHVCKVDPRGAFVQSKEI
ncbi:MULTISPECIES: homoserine kinase [unclassified Anaerobiospirillum]|uniref:homoserine kinase n=1 Tax=unclassified Anaerobiospirillum TaxID=2647410 RepID=UPI001FF4A588|nr:MULTISPECIES: homoserine kinase [unclassified Anaerobiospirillum]MCK0535649.1 homoserine kinase [Anaerobiospirillum sp. NML120511]MCK0540801.1 homoserine kinase [Anaerobiospirillum sp. NML02-A-032]